MMEWIKHYILPTVVFIIGLVTSFYIFFLTRDLRTLEREEAFLLQANNHFFAIEEGMLAGEDILVALKAFLENRDGITRIQFDRFSQTLLDRHSHIQALEWVVRVPHKDKEVYEKKLQEQGHKHFTIIEPGANGLVPVKERPEYFPVYYVSPLKGNEEALGFDLASNPTRLSALQEARDTGKPVMTNKVTLVQETTSQAGVLVFLPIYKDEAHQGTIEEKRLALTGFALIVIRVDDVVKIARQNLSDTVNITITDTQSGETLYTDTNGEIPEDGFMHERLERLGNRAWVIKLYPKLGAYENETPYVEWLVLLSAIIITSLSTLFISQLVQSNQRMLLKVKRGTQDLHTSQERFSLAAEGASVGIWDWIDVDKDEEYWSPQFYKLLGYKEGEISATFSNFSAALHPGDVDRTTRMIEGHFKGECPFEIEYRLRHKSGDYLWFKGSGQVSRDANGKPLRMVGSIHDINTLKVIEKSLIDSLSEQSKLSARLETIIDTAVDAIITIDPAGTVETFNRAAQTLFGYTEADVIGQNVRMLMPEHDKNQHDTYIKNYRETKKPQIIGIGRQVTGRKNDGSTFPMELSVGDIVENNETTGFIGIIRDVTARVEAEENLLTSLTEQNKLSARLETIIDTAVDAIITIDPAGTVETFNRAAQTLFGYTEADVIGQNVRMLMPEHDKNQHDTYIKNYRETKKPQIIGIGRQVTGRKNDGSTFPMELSVGDIVENNETTGFIGIIRDVTIRVEAEKDLRTYTEELRRSNADLEQFAYVASHDLKAPLRGIHTLAEWIEESIEDVIDDETRSHMNLLKGRIKRLENLLSSLLQYSRISAGQKETEIIDLNQVVGDAVDLLSSTDKKVKVEYELPTITSVKSMLEQIFHNIISNAIKHHHGDTVTIQIAYTLSDNMHVISVTDDGPGIPQEMSDRVFKMFQTLQPRDKVEGSGMGLAIVKKLIERHHGKIWLDQVKDKKNPEKSGVTVVFSLPVI